jgi:hypothetical protein
MSQPSRPMIAVPCAVPAPTYDGLGRLAKQAGMRRELYAAQLLTAAYAARVKPNGEDPELEAAVAELQNDTASHDDTIRHLIHERDGWKKTAENLRVELNNVRADKATLLGTSEARLARITAMEKELSEEAALRVGAIERMKAAELKQDALQEDIETLQRRNNQLLTEIAQCARPLPPIVTVTAKPDLSPQSREAISAMAIAARAALSRPGPLMCALPDAEIIPPKPEAPLSPEFISRVVAYRWAGLSVEQIAEVYQCSWATVRKALRMARRRGA